MVSASKQPLKMRLLDTLATGVEVRIEDDTRADPNLEDRFNATAHWVELQHDATPVDNPTADRHHVPANHDTTEENALHNFDKTFDQAIFL